MAYASTPSDDSSPTATRDIPSQMRRYTCAFTSDATAVFRLPLDVKVCTLINATDQALDFFLTKYQDAAYTDLHTAGTSSLILTVAAGATFPIAQHEEWNSIDFKAGSAATGTVTLLPGSGQENDLATVATRALVAV